MWLHYMIGRHIPYPPRRADAVGRWTVADDVGRRIYSSVLCYVRSVHAPSSDASPVRSVAMPFAPSSGLRVI